MAYKQPDKNSFTGGSRTICLKELMTAVLELEKEKPIRKSDPSFQTELDQLLKQYVGGETPLYYAKNLTKYVGGGQDLSKRRLTTQGGS